MSGLTDKQMAALESSAKPKAKPDTIPLTGLSDDEIAALERKTQKFDPNQQGIVSVLAGKGLDVAEKMGGAYDSVTGAPTRAALDKALSGGSYVDTINAFRDQFRADPSLAPTGKEIASKRLGFSTTPASKNNPLLFSEPGEKLGSIPLPGGKKFDIPSLLPERGGALDVSPAGVAGVGIDIAADPTMVLPVGAMIKGTVKGVEGAGRLAAVPGRMMAPGITNTVKEGYGAGKNYIKNMGKFINPKIDEQFYRAQQIAEQYGIPVEALSDSLKYGEGSFIARKGRQMAEGPAGAERLDRHNNALNQIRDAFDKHVADTYSGGAAPLDRQSAGDLIRNAYNNALDEAFNAQKTTYDSVGRQLGNPTIDPEARQALTEHILDIKSKAEKIAQRGSTENVQKEAAFTLRQLQWIEPIVKTGSYLDVVEAMKDIGPGAYKSFMDIGWNEKAARQMYDGMRDAIFATTKKVGGDKLAMELDKANLATSELINRQKILDPIIKNRNNAGDKIFQQIVESGDGAKLQALSNILQNDPQSMGQIKGAFLEGLKTEDKDLRFSFANLGSSIRNNNKNASVLKNLFSPEEVKAIEDLTWIGEKHGAPVLSSSGSSAGISFSPKNLANELGASSGDEGFLGWLKQRAEQNSKPPPPAPFPAAPGAVPQAANSFSPGMQQAVRAANEYLQSLPGRSKELNRLVRAYSVQDNAVERRLKGKK